MLKVENLEAYYGGNRALKGVSLEVRQGEIVCLIGANGAGKTTLLNCLSGVHPNRSGKVIFMGKDVSKAQSQEFVRSGNRPGPGESAAFRTVNFGGEFGNGGLFARRQNEQQRVC